MDGGASLKEPLEGLGHLFTAYEVGPTKFEPSVEKQFQVEPVKSLTEYSNATGQDIDAILAEASKLFKLSLSDTVVPVRSAAVVKPFSVHFRAFSLLAQAFHDIATKLLKPLAQPTKAQNALVNDDAAACQYQNILDRFPLLAQNYIDYVQPNGDILRFHCHPVTDLFEPQAVLSVRLIKDKPVEIIDNWTSQIGIPVSEAVRTQGFPLHPSRSFLNDGDFYDQRQWRMPMRMPDHRYKLLTP